jgi:hypothetical protein
MDTALVTASLKQAMIERILCWCHSDVDISFAGPILSVDTLSRRRVHVPTEPAWSLFRK